MPKLSKIDTLSSFGFGVEKVSEELKMTFPEKNIEIISSDTCNSREKILSFIERMKNKEIDIIIGTQMLSKGHDFPEISLVILVNMCFFAFDFRLSEIMMQNLLQVGGRGGRGQKEAEVIIKTNQPNSTLIEKMKTYDYQGFLEEELQQRLKWELPPYFRLIMICTKKMEHIKFISSILKPLVHKIYDPIESIENCQKVFKVIVKIERSFKNINRISEILLEQRCKIDLDPYDLL